MWKSLICFRQLTVSGNGSVQLLANFPLKRMREPSFDGGGFRRARASTATLPHRVALLYALPNPLPAALPTNPQVNHS